MSEGKISISMDEVNRAIPVPGSDEPITWANSVEDSIPSEPSPKKKTVFALAIALAVAAVALACMIGYCLGNRGGSAQRYLGRFVASVNAELANPSSEYRQYIENAHVTVTVKSARVIQSEIHTVDGTDATGENHSNIAMISLLIRFDWEGITESGYSDLRVVIDVPQRRITERKIVDTSAMVDITDFGFWVDVGSVFLGLLLE